jgi:hypothetical protein
VQPVIRNYSSFKIQDSRKEKKGAPKKRTRKTGIGWDGDGMGWARSAKTKETGTHPIGF